ncbi:hypothetical protein CLAIMM_14908 [Cladophialophora immunda]|nr:hypothetical protein CLAIMM_14908 [Cladophialophora immunda]
MATLTSTHRGFGSASLNVAPTQNTAPVHEFRCLYTRDLHKKAKKWHDGSLRFHTFNRRVMVYDDAKNYIGDLHYRQEEEFAEGVEIQLDRGVMVEVGERLGETQTDLAPILERSRPEKPPPPPQRTTAMASRPLSTGPSQRPKSLLEVLGPSQGRLGRARLSAHSPYEQRWSSSRAGLVESPRKRQRLECDKENQFDQDHQLARPARPRLPQPKQPSKTVPQPARRVEPPKECEEFLELSSDDEPKRQQPTKPTRLATGVVGDRIGGSPEEQWLTPTLSRARPSRVSQVHARKEKADEERRKRSKAPGNTKTPANHESLTILRAPVAPTSRLLIGKPKPRLKLTCVLPFSKGSSRPQTLESSCRQSRQERVSPTLEEDVSSSPKQAVPANVDDCLQPIQVPCSGQSSTHGSVQEDNITFSPLFIPEENPEEYSPSPQPLPTQEEFPFPGSENSELSQSPPKSNLPAEPVTKPAPQLDVDFRAPAKADCLRPQSVFVVHPQTRNQSELVSGRSNGTDTRQFRRVFSENDAVEDDAFTLMAEPAAPQSRSPLGVLGKLAARKSPTKPKNPSKLQRCASDTNAADTDTHHMEGLTEEGTRGPTGPWTEDEAFLLFDWWPADMEKPVYWKDSMEHDLPRGMPAALPDVRPGITTARQFLFLRNDVNVL